MYLRLISQACIVLILFVANFCNAQDKGWQEAMKKAMNATHRPKDDAVRDANRKPIETLKYFGFKETMSVLDINPGSGYYIRLLAPVLRDKGQLYIAVATQYLEESLLGDKPFDKVNVLSKQTKMHRPEGERYYRFDRLDLGKGQVDLVTNFRTYHLYDTQDRIRLNNAIYKKLKPGGTYALIDHTARHGEPPSSENRRRFDPVKAIAEIQAAGFVFTDFSTMHYKAEDSLDLEVGDKSVRGKTDRWTLKFTKPH